MNPICGIISPDHLVGAARLAELVATVKDLRYLAHKTLRAHMHTLLRLTWRLLSNGCPLMCHCACSGATSPTWATCSTAVATFTRHCCCPLQPTRASARTLGPVSGIRAGHSSPIPGKLAPAARPARPSTDSHAARAYGIWCMGVRSARRETPSCRPRMTRRSRYGMRTQGRSGARCVGIRMG